MVMFILHHAAHSTHTTHSSHTTGHSASALFLDIGDECFGGEEHACNASCILQSRACHLHRINDTCFEHIHILTCERIEAISTSPCAYIVDCNSSIASSIFSNLAQRFFECAAQDVNACLLVTRSNLNGIQGRNRVHQYRTAARYNTLFNCGACSRERILNTMLLLF